MKKQAVKREKARSSVRSERTLKLPVEQTADPTLSGGWLRVAKIAWILLAIAALVVMLAALPGYAAKFGGQLGHATEGALPPGSRFFAAASGAASLAAALLSVGLSALLFRRRFGEPVAALLAFFLLLYGIVFGGPLEFAADYWLGSAQSGIVLQGLLIPSPLIALLLLFPNGRFVPRWTRWLLLLVLPWNIALLWLIPFDAAGFGRAPLLTVGLTVMFISFALAGLYAQAFRYRRAATHNERQQIRWAAYGFALWTGYVLLSTIPYIHLSGLPPDAPTPWWGPASELGWWLSLGVLPLCLTIAITRYRLWNIDLLINRTLVYGGLTAVILTLYAATVGGAGLLLQQQSSLTAVLITAVLAALFFQPLRGRLQAGVDRLVPIPDHMPPAETAVAPKTAAPTLPLVLWAIVITIAAAGLALLILSDQATPAPAWGFRGFQFFPGLFWTTVGALVMHGLPRNPMGPILFAMGVCAVAIGFAEEYAILSLLAYPGRLPGGMTAAVLANWLWMPAFVLATWAFLLAPNGRLPAKRWQLVGWVSLLWLFPWSIRYLVEPGPLANLRYLDNPLGISDLTAGALRLRFPLVYFEGINLLLLLLALLRLVFRYRQTQRTEQQQIKWIGLAAVLLITGSPVGYLPGRAADVFMIAIDAAIAACIGVAVLRYRLWDIDLVINRTLVYGGLTAVVLGLYGLLVGGMGVLFQSQGNWLATLVITGLVAVLFQPLRAHLQRSVNRFMYGQRDEPFEVLARLGERLEGTLSPENVYPMIVETVSQALKLPYAAVAVPRDGGWHTAESHGRPVAAPVIYPLTYQGETVGQLRVARRAPDEAFSPADERILRNIARQAGTAVHAVQLMADLQQSRQQLVTAREEERRRLRRDLHDGLGASLAGLHLQVGALHRAIRRDPAEAEALADELRGEIRGTIDEIRRLVYELRPPTLDQLGLIEALRAHAARCSRALEGERGLQITIDAPEELPPFPAAVEVAAYRIAQEAMTNVVHHAHARHCHVRLAVGAELALEIVDDGIGGIAGRRRRHGLGLVSMRERASELGGDCIIEERPGGGTRVFACLPLLEG